MSQPIAVNGRYWPQRAPETHGTGLALYQLAPLTLVFYSLLLFPPEVSVTLAGFYLPAYRLALLAMTLPAIVMLLRRRGGQWTFVDVTVVFITFWILLSFSVVYGPGTGIVRGAGIIVDTTLPYLVARASIRSFDDLRYLLLLCLPGLAVSASILALESISGRLLLRPAVASIFGSGSLYSSGEASGSLLLRPEFRLGLLRAYGTFSHPILGGIIMAAFLPLYYFSNLRSWPFYIGLMVSLAAFFSLSSAAFLALMIAAAGIGIFHLKPYFPKVSWWLIMSMLAMVVWMLHMVSEGGIISVISRLTLTPHTASYRTLIWEFGLENVVRHPWFGMGYSDWARLWWMGESVDAHFLLLAMRHGVLVPIVLLLAFLYGMIRLGRSTPYLSANDRKFAVGLNIAVFIFLVSAQTVTFFGSSNLVFMALLAFLAATGAGSQVRYRIPARQHHRFVRKLS